MHNLLSIRVKICLLVSMSLILSYVQIPIIPIAPFLTLDVAVLPLLETGLLFGRRYGMIAILFKNVLYWLLQGANLMSGVGVLSTLISDFILLIMVMREWNKTRASLVWMTTLSLTVVMVILNAFVIMPLYVHVWQMQLDISLGMYLGVAVLPFNIIKGVVTTILLLLINRRLQRFL